MNASPLAERALDYYRADLETIPPLTREEERDLVHHLRLAHEQQLLPLDRVTRARHRLIEGNQRLVLFLARTYYRRFRRLDLEDLIQEGSLALVAASMQCPYKRERFSGYASLAIRGAFARACAQDYSASISRDTLSALCQQGKVEEHAALHACSLDQALRSDDGDLLLGETLAAPLLVLPAPGEETTQTSAQTRQVEALLAGLTERQRQVVRLCYGLVPTDQHEWSLWEIAEQLHMTETGVSQTLKQALAACRRLAEQQSQSQQHTQQPVPRRYEPPRNEHMTRKRREQFEKLQEAEHTLRMQYQRLTARRLAATAHVDDRVAREYVRLHSDPAYEAMLLAREQQCLEEAYSTLQAQGQPVTLDRLIQLTSVSLKQASAFLTTKAGDDQERLATAYAQLQAQGYKTIGRKRLAQAARTSQHRAERFLREQAARAGHSPRTGPESDGQAYAADHHR